MSFFHVHTQCAQEDSNDRAISFSLGCENTINLSNKMFKYYINFLKDLVELLNLPIWLNKILDLPASSPIKRSAVIMLSKISFLNSAYI